MTFEELLVLIDKMNGEAGNANRRIARNLCAKNKDDY